MSINNNTEISQSDSPAIFDLLNNKQYYTGVYNYIERLNSTPFTISIEGPWGSGKTSFYQSIQQLNEESENKSIVHFFKLSVWDYSVSNRDKKEILGIINDLISSIDLENRNATSRFFIKIRYRFYSALQLILNNNLFIGFINYRFGTNISSNSESEVTTTNSSINAVRLKFDKVVQNFIKRSTDEEISNKKIVILIDDLDRLKPEYSVEIIEFIQLFFNVRNCVFVLNFDREIIDAGLSKKNEYLGIKSTKWLDKMIQLRIPMPTENYDIANFLIENFKSRDLNLDKKTVDDFVEYLEIYGVEGRNPRTLKIVINSLLLAYLTHMSDIDISEKSKYDQAVLKCYLFAQAARVFDPEELREIDLFIDNPSFQDPKNSNYYCLELQDPEIHETYEYKSHIWKYLCDTKVAEGDDNSKRILKMVFKNTLAFANLDQDSGIYKEDIIDKLENTGMYNAIENFQNLKSEIIEISGKKSDAEIQSNKSSFTYRVEGKRVGIMYVASRDRKCSLAIGAGTDREDLSAEFFKKMKEDYLTLEEYFLPEPRREILKIDLNQPKIPITKISEFIINTYNFKIENNI